MKGADLLIECLKKQGVKVIFGMPGSLAREIDAAIYANKDDIKYIMVRHEGGAAYMADAYSRVTGEIGICITVPGPGAGNAFSGMLEAYTANSAVLLITAQNQSCYKNRDQSKMGHGLDQLTAFKPVTKYMKRVELVDDIPDAVYEVFGSLRLGRPKPALLEITRDALGAMSNTAICKRNNGIKVKPKEEQIKLVIKELQKAKKPCIIAGRGVSHCSSSMEVLELSKNICAPIITTKMGKGVVPESERMSLGDSDTKGAQKAIAESDLILAIGVRFTQIDTKNWTLKLPETIIRIDADPSEINSEYKAVIGIAADIKLTIIMILDRLKTGVDSCKKKDRIEVYRNMTLKERVPRYIKLLNQVLPSDAIVSLDVHMAGYSAVKYLKVEKAENFLHSPISMAMGYALPSAIGAKIAHPVRPVIAFCGDGGFLLSSSEIATIMKYNLDIVIIVINDKLFNTMRSVQLEHSGYGLDFSLYNPDLIKFAESYGMESFKVTRNRKFASTVKKAIDLKKPVLIEVIPEKTIRGMIFYGLRRFINKL